VPKSKTQWRRELQERKWLQQRCKTTAGIVFLLASGATLIVIILLCWNPDLFVAGGRNEALSGFDVIGALLLSLAIGAMNTALGAVYCADVYLAVKGVWTLDISIVII
jgi:hypothetical protein